MSDSDPRQRLARFGMTDAELDAWFAVSDVAGRIGTMNGWDHPDTHDMAHAAHVVQNFLLSRPIKRAGGSPDAPGPDAGTHPVVPTDSGSRTAFALGQAGLTVDEIDLCDSIATVAKLLHALPDVAGDERHACTHALRRVQDIVIAHAVARASGVPRPVFGVDDAWNPDPKWVEQARAAVAQAGLTDDEIEASVAIATAAQRVRALDVEHEMAWHDSMHAFRGALDGVLSRPGARAQKMS